MTDRPPIARVDSVTESRNPRTVDIDTRSTLGILTALNDEDALVAPAVRAALPQLAEVVDVAAERYRAGGNIHYFGAGTSGAIGILDAAELPPTFSIDPERVVAHRPTDDAGVAREASEDDTELGLRHAASLRPEDVAIGLTASGRTPYVAAALEHARSIGAYTVLVSSRPDGPLVDTVDTHILVETGPEAIAGSTRLKAGTAQKLVLNGFSTALMIRLGKTYSNLMVDVAPTNGKLRGRALGILEEVTGLDEETCARTLAAAGGHTKTALICLLLGVAPAQSRRALAATGGRVREAIALLNDHTTEPVGSSTETRTAQTREEEPE